MVDPVRARRQELRSRLTNQLRSAEFRFINEQLYRADRQNTGKILDVESAKIYHEGFLPMQILKFQMSHISNPVLRLFDSSEKVASQSARHYYQAHQTARAEKPRGGGFGLRGGETGGTSEERSPLLRHHQTQQTVEIQGFLAS